MSTTLKIEGLPSGWSISINGQPALNVGSTPVDPTFLAIEGKVRYTARSGSETRSALLNCARGANIVSWSEFRASKPKPSTIATALVAGGFAAVVYSARRK